MKILHNKYWNPFNYYRHFRKQQMLKRFRSVGKNMIFDLKSTFLSPEYMDFGDDVFIGEMAHFTGEIFIGNRVMFGPRPVLIGGNHYFGVKGRSNRFLHPKDRENYEKIIVEDEAWIGANVIILGGVTVGMGAVIGAGSVLTKSIPPFTIAVGNPCRPVRQIFSDLILYEHLCALNYPEDYAKIILSRRQTQLAEQNLKNLPIVDRTGEYWEFRG